VRREEKKIKEIKEEKKVKKQRVSLCNSLFYGVKKKRR
jgi:hypothetical protein